MAEQLGKDELAVELTKIITHMREKGLITEQMCKGLKDNVGAIAEDLSKTFSKGDGLTKEELSTNKNIQKKVMGMLLSKALGTPDNYNEFKAGLVREKSELVDPNAKQNEAKLNNVEHKTLLAAALALDLEKLKNKYTNDVKNKNPADKDPKEKQKFEAEVAKKIEDELSQTIRMLNGGEDVRFPDRIDSVITYVSGNAKGYPNLTIPDPANVSSYMVERNTPNTGKDASPVVASLLDSAVSTLSQALTDADRPSSPSAIRSPTDISKGPGIR